MDHEYTRLAKCISNEFNVPYPLAEHTTDDLIFSHYETMAPILATRQKIEETVYKDVIDTLPKTGKFYSIFDGKLHGPFNSKNIAFEFVKNNAKMHPMSPITFLR